MFAPVDTRVPQEVEGQVLSIYRKLFPLGDAAFVPRAFGWAADCFTGRLADYQPIDARYHDFEHTLQGTLCLARLLHGRHHAKAEPVMKQKMFDLALLAILFHDSGYLKKRGDNDGTGAKYTVTHVRRSVDFAREFLTRQGFKAAAIAPVTNMISCTGVNAHLGSIPFQSDLERTLGFALATSDLLGQMAAPDYVEKLPMLYLEFAEAARYSGAKAARLAAYHSADELSRNTPSFWEAYVLPKINDDFQQVHRFLQDPWPDGPNPYIERIQKNLARLRGAGTPISRAH